MKFTIISLKFQNDLVNYVIENRERNFFSILLDEKLINCEVVNYLIFGSAMKIVKCPHKDFLNFRVTSEMELWKH